MLEEENVLDRIMKRMLIHSIGADDVIRAMSVGNKFERQLRPGHMLVKVGRERGKRLAFCSLRPARKTVNNR